MKKLFIFLGLLITTSSFSQVENGTLTSRYTTLYELNTYTDDFEIIGEDWITTTIYFDIDYYIYSIDGSDPEKVYWEYKHSENDIATYMSSDGRVFMFDFDSQEFIIFHEWDDYRDEFDKMMVFSKTSFKKDN